MSEKAMWQGDAPAASATSSAGTAIPVRVTADSFRLLTEKLKLGKQTAAQPVPAIDVVHVPPIPTQPILTQPPVTLPPFTLSPEAPVQKHNPVQVQTEPVIFSDSDRWLELPDEIVVEVRRDNFEIDPDLAVLEVPKPSEERIKSVLVQHSLHHDEELVPASELTPILPPPLPPKPIDKSAQQKFQPEHRRQLSTAELELEMVMRAVSSTPTLDERAAYLEEAAMLHSLELQPDSAVQPVEDLEALAMEHMRNADLQVERQAAPQSLVFDLELAEAEPRQVEASETAQDSSPVPETPDVLKQTFALPTLAEQSVASLDFPLVQAPVAEAQVEIPVTPSTEKSERVIERATKPVRAASTETAPIPAANMSDTAVSDLARSLLDMMASSSSTGLPQERALAADTLLRIMERLPMRTLVHLSERLSMMDNPPHLIAGKILQDPRIEVSGPFLENAMHIADQDLDDVISSGNTEKLRLLARRRKLSRAVTDRLIKSGIVSVLLTLVRNAHAEISHEGFNALTDLASHEADLLAPLATRADLPPPQAFEIFWHAPAQLRRYILSRFLTDSETLTKILKITLATQGEDAANEKFPEFQAVEDGFSVLLAGDSDAAAEKLAELLQLHATTIQRILADSSGEPLIALLKSAGVPRAKLGELLVSLQRHDNGFIDRNREIEELQNVFDTLSYNKARILLTYWDWHSLGLGPYAPLN